MRASDRQVLSQRQDLSWHLQTVLKAQVKSTQAQQQEKSRLSLNLSFFEVTPVMVVPLIARTTVDSSVDTKA